MKIVVFQICNANPICNIIGTFLVVILLECVGCQEAVITGGGYANGHLYHQQCFKCYNCQVQLEDKFSSAQGKLLCNICFKVTWFHQFNSIINLFSALWKDLLSLWQIYSERMCRKQWTVLPQQMYEVFRMQSSSWWSLLHSSWQVSLWKGL